MRTLGLLDRIQQQMLKECKARNLEIDLDFAHFLVHILVRDARLGLDLNKFISECKIEYFIDVALRKYADPLDATFCNIKLSYFFKNCKEIEMKHVEEKYKKSFKNKLQILIDDILQYPENSNNLQIDQMQHKMLIFIIACYNIGCPKNHVLLNQARQSLKSVIGRSDLQNYILKKKYHRLEYLQRLSATVCGIIIYNNSGPAGDKENMRDIMVDLEMAKGNTKEFLEGSLSHINDCIAKGTTSMQEIVVLNPAEGKAYCHWPIEKVREINNYVVLFCVYQHCLARLLKTYEKTEYLMTVSQTRYKCVIEKINDVLKYRTAIDSEVIFPHFAYLSEVWSELTLYLNHLVEINKIKDQMDIYVSKELTMKFIKTIDDIQEKIMKKPNVTTFAELIERANKPKGNSSCVIITDSCNEYCVVTLALTHGLVVPANMHKKICANSEIRYGFGSMELSKFGERNFEDVKRTFRNCLITSVDLILLFNLEKEVFRQDFEAEQLQIKQKQKTIETQTEMVVVNDLSESNHINVTWNAWDFHRQTIHMAELRKRQTHSSQTMLSYGQRNAQNQAYNTRRHF